MAFVTYLYRDPKTSVLRYVGKGLTSRPYEHLYKNSSTRLSRMLHKRLREGYNPRPIILEATDENDAFEMEMCLIALIGREDLGQGSLFNRTNGGEGCSGREVSQHERLAKSLVHSRMTHEERLAYLKSKSIGASLAHKRMSRSEKLAWVSNLSKAKMKPCTVDGQTIYNSRSDLVSSLGHGKTGARSPNFRYV